jgi:TrmH family RNA methyltransferase
MYSPLALAKLHPKHRLRKASLLLEEAERGMRSSNPHASLAASDYASTLAGFLAADGDAPEEVRKLAASARAILTPSAGSETVPEPRVGASADVEAIRAVNGLRHLLLRVSGQAPADWDLLDPLSGRPDPAARRAFPGMFSYLEDIRSPFNVGSILRSSDAFGLAELILSPDTADPGHPRALRSAMGSASLVPWRRAGLDALAPPLAVFALELGGTPLEDFRFPEQGIVVVGSEELGVSAAALSRCDLGKVSIPMSGAKGSLNVGVAYGILLHAWSRSLSTAGHANSV